MNVTVIGWSDADAVAEVDRVRVRIRRGKGVVRWMCDEHGIGLNNPHHCTHTTALADTPADPARHNKAGTTERGNTR